MAKALICVADDAVRSAILFAFAVEGIETQVCSAAQSSAWSDLDAHCAIIDQGPDTPHPRDTLARLRSAGFTGPAIVLVGTSRSALRQELAASGLTLIDKPLLRDELVAAVHEIITSAGGPR